MRVKKLMSFVFFVSCTMAVVVLNLKNPVQKTGIRKRVYPSPVNELLQAAYKQNNGFQASLMAIQSK